MQSDTSLMNGIYDIVDAIKPSTVELTDSEGNVTADRESAAAITFPYFRYGKMTVSILNPNNLQVLVSPNMDNNMDDRAKTAYKNFIMKMKKVSDSYPDVKFTITKVTGDDFHKALVQTKGDDLKASKEKELSMNNISEALNPMFGSSRSSYQQLDNIKMIVKHARPVDESIKGSRTRAIKAIYLENSQGERFRLPINNLWAGRAMARHMVNAGTMYDVVGQRILEWAGRIGKLQKFQRYVKNNGLLNENTTEIMNAVTQNISDAKDILMKLSNPRHYGELVNNMPVAPTMQAEDDRINGLKETFTVKTFDESLEDTLPIIGALIMEKEKDQSGDVFGMLPEVMSVLKAAILDKNLDPKVLTAVKSDITTPEGASKLGIKAAKLADAFTGKNDNVSNFMSRMSDMLDDYHNKMAYAKEKASPEFRKSLAIVQAMVNADELGAFGQGVSENGLDTAHPMESFKNWASMVIEGISVSPTNSDQQKKLNELLSTPIELGEDGINAIGSLIGLIEDDRLDDMLSNLAEKDSSVDARPVVINWLKAHDMVNILEDATVDALAKDGMNINEGLIGGALGGVAGAALTRTPGGAISGAKIGSAIQDKLTKTEDTTDYDTKYDGAYDRGGADAWYHRPRKPHKIIDGKKVALTDPEEIKAYHAGYDYTDETEGRTGGKQYEDLNEAKKAKAKAKVREAKMSPAQKAKREKIVKGMKKSKADFKDRYGKRGEEVMYATATKQAMKEAEQQGMDAEVVKILTQIYNVIKEAAPSMSQEIADHLFNANKNVVAAINAAKATSTVGESAKSKKKINEAPVGVGQRLGTWARGKTAGALGPLARGWQAQIAGEKEVNAYANKLNIEFRKALGIKKINPNDPAAIDLLYNWAKGSGLPVTDSEVEQKFQAAKTASSNIKTAGAGVPDSTAATPSATAPVAEPALGTPAPTTPSSTSSTVAPKLGAAGENPYRSSTVAKSSGIEPMGKKNNKPLRPAIRRVVPPTSSIAPMGSGNKPLNPVRRRVEPTAMKEDLNEDKKTLEQLIYALADATLSKGISTGTTAGATSTATPAGTGSPNLDAMNTDQIIALAQALQQKMKEKGIKGTI